MAVKEPFDIAVALAAIEEAVRPFPKAALFDLAAQGYRSVFQQTVACMLSIRTRDETTLVVARELFRQANSPAAIRAMGEAALDRLIHASSFHEAKARQILAIAARADEEFGGELPCDRDLLLALPGIGPKCAHLVLGIACGQPYIGVDIHVHRVTNRWGYVAAASPEATMAALERVLPRRYWVDINRLLVPFGKHICTGALPHCATCPVQAMCRQIGVTRHR